MIVRVLLTWMVLSIPISALLSRVLGAVAATDGRMTPRPRYTYAPVLPDDARRRAMRMHPAAPATTDRSFGSDQVIDLRVYERRGRGPSAA